MQARAVRVCEQGHDLSGRDRGAAAHAAGQAPARAPGLSLRAGGRTRRDRGRHPRDRRHEPRPGPGDGPGEFREDLYYRLNVIEIRIPPLRQRKDEIPALASGFLARFNKEYGRNKQLSAEMLARLVAHSWSGNVRELENAIRRFVVLSDGERAFETLFAGDRNGHSAVPRLAVTATESLREIARRGAREAERKALEDVLERVRWNRSEAARILKVSYKTLLTKIKDCQCSRPRPT